MRMDPALHPKEQFVNNDADIQVCQLGSYSTLGVKYVANDLHQEDSSSRHGTTTAPLWTRMHRQRMHIRCYAIGLSREKTSFVQVEMMFQKPTQRGSRPHSTR
jgi:hypothetical protein